MINLLSHGVFVKSFDAVANPSNGTAGTVFALPTARSVLVTWGTKFGVAPDAVSIALQTSIDNVNWHTIDTTTAVAGELRTLGPILASFIRAYFTSRTNGSAITVNIGVV